MLPVERDAAMPRRILMTTDAVGGIWTYSLDLAAGLADRGASVVLAVLGPPPSPAQQTAAAAVPRLRLHVVDAPLDWTAAGPEELARAAAAVAALGGSEQVDLVHLNSPVLAALARFGRPVVGVCHSCLATWWAALRGDAAPLPADFAWRRTLVARGYDRTDVLVAPSSAFARATAQAYGLPCPPTVVHNGRRPGPRAVPGAPSFVFAAGRLWDEGKNVAALDRAAALLEAPVLAAGPTRGPNGARAAFRHLRALGPLDASGVAAWLAQGPLFVSLARFEPFGLAVLEAAQAGCALLLSDTPTFRELWDGAAVFLPCDADDTAVAASIRTVLADAERGAGLRAAALERAARYGTAPMTEGMLRVYGRAVAAHQDGRMRREHAA